MKVSLPLIGRYARLLLIVLTVVSNLPLVLVVDRSLVRNCVTLLLNDWTPLTWQCLWSVPLTQSVRQAVLVPFSNENKWQSLLLETIGVVELVLLLLTILTDRRTLRIQLVLMSCLLSLGIRQLVKARPKNRGPGNNRSLFLNLSCFLESNVLRKFALTNVSLTVPCPLLVKLVSKLT